MNYKGSTDLQFLRIFKSLDVCWIAIVYSSLISFVNFRPVSSIGRVRVPIGAAVYTLVPPANLGLKLIPSYCAQRRAQQKPGLLARAQGISKVFTHFKLLIFRTNST